MSQLTHGNSVCISYGMYDSSPVGFSFTRGKGVCTGKQERVRTREQEKERDKKSDEGSAYRSFRVFPRRSFTLLQKPDSPVSH